jgi:Protein of unknown function VcgC/VcgE (DUF2780)
MEVLTSLMDNLGVTEEQAKGGAGAIFSMVKDKLGDESFNKIADVIPGMDDILSAAPESGGVSGLVGGLASKLGGGAEKLGGIASIAGAFKNLGLDADMVGKFAPIILSFVQSKGGDTIKDLLAGALE